MDDTQIRLCVYFYTLQRSICLEKYKYKHKLRAYLYLAKP